MFSQTAADLRFWRRRITSVAAHKIYSRMSIIPIAPPPWASVAFPLYRVYWAPRPSSGQVSRLRICPTEAMVDLYLDRLGDVLERCVCMHRWGHQICPEIWTSKDRQLMMG